MYSFSIRQFIWEYIGDFYDSWMFGPNFFLMLLMFGGGGGFINTMLTLLHTSAFKIFKYQNNILCKMNVHHE